jgi:TRAP-type C4-dicarboxylate transport system substrate-binding protein
VTYAPTISRWTGVGQRHRTARYLRLASVWTAAVVFVALTGCADSSGSDGDPAVDTAAPSTSAVATDAPSTVSPPDATLPTAPDHAEPASVDSEQVELVGTWSRTVTVAEAQAAGADPGFVQAELMPNGLDIRYQFDADGTWIQLGDYCKCGVFERGALGVFEFDDEGRLVVNEPSQGTGRGVVEWRLEGDVLTLESAEFFDGDEGPFPFDPVSRVMTLGEYTRLSADAVVPLSIATVPGWESELNPLVAALQDEPETGVALEVDVAWIDANFGEDVEQRIIAAVAAGELDAGYVGVRALSALGPTGFDALVAPGLVDSYELQQAVLDSDIPDRLLPTLDDLGVMGLAIAAGPMRYPLGIEGPFARPEAFSGATFHTYPAPINTATAEALGSVHSQVFGDARDDAIDEGRIDVTENTLLWMARNGRGSFVTLDPLWPATAVLVINPGVMAGMSPEAVDALRAAIDDSRPTVAELISAENDLIDDLCAAGKRLVASSDTARSSMRHALQPVYDELAADDTASPLVAEIEALRATVDASSIEVPDGCAA